MAMQIIALFGSATPGLKVHNHIHWGKLVMHDLAPGIKLEKDKLLLVHLLSISSTSMPLLSTNRTRRICLA